MSLQVRNWGVGVGCWDRRLWLSDSYRPRICQGVGNWLWACEEPGAGWGWEASTRDIGMTLYDKGLPHDGP